MMMEQDLLFKYSSVHTFSEWTRMKKKRLILHRTKEKLNNLLVLTVRDD